MSSHTLQQRVLSDQQKLQHKIRLGADGEERAVAYLAEKKHEVVAQNMRVGSHEVDIIFIDTREHTLVFCEVKTRSTNFFGDPSRAVSLKKILSMQIVARVYLKKSHWHGAYRFDVIAVLPDSIAHFENVTW